MSIVSGRQLLLSSAAAAAATGISRSLRFNSSDSGFLSRTPGSAGNRKTWTWAGWVKRSSLSTGLDVNLFTGGVTNSDTGFMGVYIDNNHKLTVAGATTNFLVSNSVYRDVSAWYHIIAAFDATQGTNANKIKLYVNGDLLTNFAIDNRASISNQDYGINQAAAHAIGRSSLNGARYFDGYLADIYFIDGQVLDPSSFTEVSATTGQLIPKAYSGPTPTGNSFWLPFSDNSAATATTLGKDGFNLGNNWTPNNLSVTAGAGNDSLVDTPTSYGTDAQNGGEVRGNYATWNPLDKGSSVTLANGNLDFSQTATLGSCRGTIGVSSGKWYWEVSSPSSGSAIGIMKASANISDYVGGDANGWSYYANNGFKYNSNSGASYGATFGSGDVIGVAFDADAGTLTFYKNGTSQGQAYSGLTSGPYFPAFGNGSTSCSVNFGQRAFAYTAPSGFKALVDTNLTAPVVAKSSAAFQTLLWTGNGNAGRAITGLDFNPDLVWLKNRSNVYHHQLFDAVRGPSAGALYSSLTNAEDSSFPITSFDSSGFTLGSSSALASQSYESQNGNNMTYVGWCWDAGSSTVSNTQGSITSQVRANASAGFSIVTWTGNGTSATVGHGLGVAPAMMIVKSRNTTNSWVIYHQSLGGSQFLLFDTSAAGNSSNATWGSGNSNPTSTVFSVGNGAATNGNGNNMVAYCWAPLAGYSSFGSYNTNGSTDGPYIHLGFRPRLVLLKATTSHPYGSWRMYDSARGSYNVIGPELYPNGSSSEYGGGVYMDFTANGFKIRENSFINDAGHTFIYCAWAESPFQYARAR